MLSVCLSSSGEFLTTFELGYGRISAQARRAAQPVSRRRQAAGRNHPHSGNQGGLWRILLGHHYLIEPFIGCGGHCGQNAADRAQSPVEDELAEEDHLVNCRPRHRARRGEHPEGDGQIEPAASLGQAGR